MKNTFLICLIVSIIALMASCAPKHHCKGLKAHPNYQQSWSRK